MIRRSVKGLRPHTLNVMGLPTPDTLAHITSSDCQSARGVPLKRGARNWARHVTTGAGGVKLPSFDPIALMYQGLGDTETAHEVTRVVLSHRESR